MGRCAFKALGFLPVLTPVSDERIAQLGINLAHTEFCIAMKLVVGHGALLNSDERIHYIFNPSFIEEVRTSKPNRKFCIYTEAEATCSRTYWGSIGAGRSYRFGT